MPPTSIGDLALGFVLRARNTDLRQTLTRLGTEMVNERVSGTADRLDGHFAYLSQIEHDLVMAKSVAMGAKEVEITAAAMQRALDRIGEVTNGVIETLIHVSAAPEPADTETVAADARGALDSIVAALNTGMGGRHLFSGVDVDTAPLATANTILAELKTAIGDADDPAEAIARAGAFFDAPGGGFDSAIYQGSADGLAPVRLGAGESADLDLRADHAALRATIKHAALAALADDPGLALNDADRREMLGAVRGGLLAARDSQVALQADLGFAEGRIARAQTRIEAERTTLERARNALVAVDPYEAVTEMEAVQLQLETLYAVTERTSRLSLVNYLS